MKRNTANQLAGILAGKKLTRIKDASVRDTMLDNYVALRKEAKALSEEQRDIITKFNIDWKEDKDTKKDEYEKALADINESLQKRADMDVDIPISPVSRVAFLDGLSDDDFSFEQMAILIENEILT